MRVRTSEKFKMRRFLRPPPLPPHLSSRINRKFIATEATTTLSFLGRWRAAVLWREKSRKREVEGSVFQPFISSAMLASSGGRGAGAVVRSPWWPKGNAKPNRTYTHTHTYILRPCSLFVFHIDRVLIHPFPLYHNLLLFLLLRRGEESSTSSPPLPSPSSPVAA